MTPAQIQRMSRRDQFNDMSRAAFRRSKALYALKYAPECKHDLCEAARAYIALSRDTRLSFPVRLPR